MYVVLNRVKFAVMTTAVFKNSGKNNIQIKEKREFLRKIGFWCDSKTNDRI